MFSGRAIGPPDVLLHAAGLGLVAVTLPLGRFAGRAAFPAPEWVLHEGIPDHLDQPLRNWIYAALGGGGAELIALKLEIRIDYEMARGNAALFLARDSQRYELLGIVNAILGNGGPWPAPLRTDRSGRNSNAAGLAQLREDLIQLLASGSSAWQVNSDSDGLVRRVDETATEAVEQSARAAATPAAGSATDQIRSAWAELYGLHPDPPAAYRAAVQAVESAAHAIVEPNNAAATLGTMLRQLRSAPQRYALAIPGPAGIGSVEPLTGMLDLLWKGQTSRHGAQTAQRAETFEEAQMAVHLAVTLVHWFTTGAVRRIP
jgi:hypothetical protein